MPMTSVGDLAQSFILTRHGTQMKTDIQRLTNEVTTGVADDTARHLAGDFGPLAGIDGSLARLGGYRSVTAEAGLFTDTMQSALERIDTMAADLGGSLLAGATSSTPTRVSALGTEAVQKLGTALSALNTRLGDRSLFSGIESATSPLPEGAALLDTLQGVVAGARTAEEVETALTTWFGSANGFGAAYRGGAALAPLNVADGESARIDITAEDPAIRDTLKGLAMAALLGRGLLDGQPEARADIVRRSGEALMAAQDARSNLMARLGITQEQIEQAEQRNIAETSALGIARSELLSVDSYEVAAQLQQTQTQLETLYTLTARMSRLSLVNFL